MVSLIIVALLFVFAPYILPPSIAADILVFSLFALAFDILFGHMGIVSFGHAAYFGLGAYGAALFLTYVKLPPTLLWLSILAGVLLAGAGAWVFGFLSLRRSGLYLALITLAFSQMVWFVMLKWTDVTGGENGLVNLPTLVFQVPGVFTVNMNSPILIYYFNFVVVFVAMILLYRLLYSPFGLIIRSIRDNEERVGFLGYNVQRYKLMAFIASGLFSGLAGALYCIYQRFVALHTLDWIMSGDVVLMTLIGGGGTFFGPIVGAAIYIGIRDIISFYTAWWRIIVGVILVIVILFFRQGLWGMINTLRGR